MRFPEYDNTDGRMLVPIDGRGLFVTNSASVEFLDLNQRDSFPLVSAQLGLYATQILAANSSWTVPIEAKGFLLLAPGSAYCFHQSAQYERFEFVPTYCSQVPFYLPVPVPNVTAYGYYGQDTNYYYYAFSMSDNTVIYGDVSVTYHSQAFYGFTLAGLITLGVRFPHQAAAVSHVVSSTLNGTVVGQDGVTYSEFTVNWDGNINIASTLYKDGANYGDVPPSYGSTLVDCVARYFLTTHP